MFFRKQVFLSLFYFFLTHPISAHSEIALLSGSVYDLSFVGKFRIVGQGQFGFAHDMHYVISPQLRLNTSTEIIYTGRLISHHSVVTYGSDDTYLQFTEKRSKYGPTESIVRLQIEQNKTGYALTVPLRGAEHFTVERVSKDFSVRAAFDRQRKQFMLTLQFSF